MTEEASTRILNRLERILEAIDDVNPVEIADHVRSDSMGAWTKSLRDYVYERVEEIESEVQKCEEIAWCRDCWHSVTFMTMGGEEVTNCNYWGQRTEPDGFCAWGERKAAE